MSLTEQDLIYRLQKRAEIRRQIPSRKSVQNNEPDRISDLLEEAAAEILELRALHKQWIDSAVVVLDTLIRAQNAE